MEGAETKTATGKRPSKSNLGQFKESFETFNNIINDLQRQYLSLEKEFTRQGRRLEEINQRLRQTIDDNREMTSFLNSILTSLTSGVVAVDRDGVVSHFNPAAERIIGISAEEALGRKYDEVIAAEAGAEFSALDTVFSGSEFDSEEKTIVNGDGREIPVSVSTSLLRDRERNCRGAVEIFFDLTKIKRLEAEISRVQTLAALGEMAATVAHEVRNPLGGIGGFAALLRREVEGDEAKTKLVDKIITGVNNLNETVVALLDYTRHDQLNLRDVSLRRLVSESAEYEKAELENCDIDIEFKADLPSDDLKVACDPHLMRQVLLNLVRNSREAISGGGRITIRARQIENGERCPIPVPAVCLEVSDDGCGIPGEIQDKIFRPFFSTKCNKSGSGLGLASVWKTVQAHNGSVSVISERGEGTTFRIFLPL